MIKNKTKTFEELERELESLEVEKIHQLFLDYKKSEEDARFVSLMSDYVLKTICSVGNAIPKKAIYKMFRYILDRDFEEFHLTTNETGVTTFKSIANRQDFHFINEKKSHHVLIEVNKTYRNLATDEKALSTMFKVGGDFYAYLSKKSEKYKMPIRVELINLNNYYCPYGDNIPSNVFKFRDIEYNLEMEEMKIYNIYLPNFIHLCYDKYAKEEEKTLAMFSAKNYKMLRALAEGNIEREALYVMAREFAKYPEFMELYDKEAYESAVRRELKEQGHEEGFAEGHTLGLEEGRTLGLEEGRTLGLEEGAQNTQIEIAKNMLREGDLIEIVAKRTGLSLQEIDKLLDEVPHGEGYDKEAYEDAVRRELKEQGLEEGRTLGLEEGAQNTQIEIAKNMLREGDLIEIVAKRTGLSLQEIYKLLDEVPHEEGYDKEAYESAVRRELKEQGLEEGRNKEKFEIAKSMLDDGMKIEKVSFYTGIAREELLQFL